MEEIERQLEAALAAGDPDALLTLVHQLKGSAGSYGFPRISELARECQDRLREQEPVEALLPQLAELLREVGRASGQAQARA